MVVSSLIIDLFFNNSLHYYKAFRSVISIERVFMVGRTVVLETLRHCAVFINFPVRFH